MDGRSLNWNPVCDLAEIIQNYAWKRFQSSVSVTKRLFHKKDKHDFDIQWKFLDFKHVTSSFRTENQDCKHAMEFGTPMGARIHSRINKKADITECSYKNVSLDLDAPVILCTDYFENLTKSTQSYPFNSREQMRSVVSVKFIQSYSLGGSTTNIELSPSTMDSTEKALSIKNAIKQDFEDVHCFDVETEVVVESKKKAEAVISVYEKQTLTSFEITTTISLPIGCMPVVIRRKSDDKVMFTCFITSLHDVFRQHVGANLSLMKSGNGAYDVVMTSRGACTTTAWSDPELIVKAEPIHVMDRH